MRIEERYFDLYGGANFKGTGKAKCRVCGEPVRDHRIGPCPKLETSTIRGVFSSIGVTDRTQWRNGEKPPPRKGIPQVRVVRRIE